MQEKEPNTPTISRREFLYFLQGLIAGFLYGRISPDLSQKVNEIVADQTGQLTGNSGGSQQFEELTEICSQNLDNPDPDNSALPPQTPANQEIDPKTAKCLLDIFPLFDLMTLLSSVTEEVVVRGGASFLASKLNKSPNILEEIVRGAQYPDGISGKQLGVEGLVGASSALLFGYLHNLTSDHGFSTSTIPAAQIVGGVSLFILARKFGIASPISAHLVHNAIITNRIKAELITIASS